MGIIRLDPTNIRTFDGVTHYGNVWNDGTDTTYAPLNAPTVTTDAKGDLSTYVGPTILAMSFHFRASATGADSMPIMVELDRSSGSRVLWAFGGDTSGNAAETFGVPLDWLIPNDGSIRDYSTTVTDPMLTFNGWTAGGIDGLRTDLAHGGCGLYLWADPGSGGEAGTVLIYEAWIEIQTAGAPPLRRYPPVNNGGSGPTRHWPRTVNRRAGGTY